MRKLFEILSYLLFTAAEGTLFSLFVGTLFQILGIVTSVSIDGGNAGVMLFPRFFPFCVVLAAVVFVLLAAIIFLNLEFQEKLHYNAWVWAIQIICAFVLTFAMLRGWENLFDFLSKAF